jgi:hypothetical protein
MPFLLSVLKRSHHTNQKSRLHTEADDFGEIMRDHSCYSKYLYKYNSLRWFLSTSFEQLYAISLSFLGLYFAPLIGDEDSIEKRASHHHIF